MQPRRRPVAQARRRQSTPAGGFVPVAAARTAGAVGGLADSGLVLHLTRSRLWIGLLGVLLVGIVALNVFALSFSSNSSAAARQADELKRQNSVLEAQISARLSSEQVQAVASRLGLAFASPGSIRYVRRSTDDAATAAQRLRSGELTAVDYATAVATVPIVPTEQVAVEVAVEPAPVADPAAAPPQEAPPAAPPETAAETAAPPAGGAVAAP